MAEISGVPTADIDNVDGFFTTQGGGGGIVADSALSGAGTMVAFSGSLNYYSAYDYTYNKRSYSTHSFVDIAASGNYLYAWAIKSDGTLWYNALENNFVSTAIPNADLDGEWHQYGTDTDWTQLSAGRVVVGAIKNNEYWFIGQDAAHYQSGMGGGNNRVDWVQANNTLTWAQCALGEENTVLLTTTGEVYTCGRNREYQTGQGTTGGFTVNLTREQNTITGVTWVAAGNQDATIVASGQIYFTGQNSGPHAGFQSTSSSDVNGFTAVNTSITDVVSTHHQSRYSLLAITTNGSIRFAGYGSNRARPDNSGSSQNSATNQLDILTGAGTGWTKLFGTGSDSSGSRYAGVGIKSGDMYCGGSVFASQVQALQNQTNTTSDWDAITNSGTPQAGAVGLTLMVVSWS